MEANTYQHTAKNQSQGILVHWKKWRSWHIGILEEMRIKAYQHVKRSGGQGILLYWKKWELRDIDMLDELVTMVYQSIKCPKEWQAVRLEIVDIEI